MHLVERGRDAPPGCELLGAQAVEDQHHHGPGVEHLGGQRARGRAPPGLQDRGHDVGHAPAAVCGQDRLSARGDRFRASHGI